MPEKPDRNIALTRALQILRERGWSPMWSTSSDSPLNIRSAVAKACTQLVGQSNYAGWHDLYLDCIHAVTAHLKEGIIAWEADVKVQTEVFAMLTEVINRLENDDINPRANRRRPRPSGL